MLVEVPNRLGETRRNICLGLVCSAESLPERRFGIGSRVCSCASCVRKPVPATSEANSATPKEEKDDGGKGQPETWCWFSCSLYSKLFHFVLNEGEKRDIDSESYQGQ